MTTGAGKFDSRLIEAIAQDLETLALDRDAHSREIETLTQSVELLVKGQAAEIRVLESLLSALGLAADMLESLEETMNSETEDESKSSRLERLAELRQWLAMIAAALTGLIC